MRFRFAHATHPDWSTATELCLQQLAAQAGDETTQRGANLGFIYLTEALAPHADAILAVLKTRTTVASWVGASAGAICATGVEYIDEPALAIMLGRFGPGTCNVFSGTQRPPALGTRTEAATATAYTALVHADPHTPALPELIVDMAGKVESGYLFGGVASGRAPPVTIADRILRGGLSGVVFASNVPLVSRITQGCHPIASGGRHTITEGDENLIARLGDERAFDVLLRDAGIAQKVAAAGGADTTRETLAQLQALGRRGLFVGIEPSTGGAYRERTRRDDYLIRHVVALDPANGLVAVAAPIERGQSIRFCVRNEAAARKDLIRICAEIRDHLHEQSERARRPVAAKGAIYVSCLGRGTHLFGEQSEELRVIQSQLGDVPLVGFYANGEIGGQHLYGFTGVLTVFY